MENLDRIIAAYEKMDRRARDEYLVLMEQSAQKYPMKEVVKLRLISTIPADKRR